MKHASILRVLFFFPRGDCIRSLFFFLLAIHKVSITKVVKQKVLLWFRAWVTWHPPVHHPKNSILGFRGWDEIVPQGSVSLVSSFFFLGLSFFSYFFFFCPHSHFFPGPFLSLAFFLVSPSLNSIFFGKLLPTPPTYLPPFHHPTHLPPPTYPTTHLRSPSSLDLQNHRKFYEELVELVESMWSLGQLGELVELGAWNINRSPHFEGKCFFSCFQNQDDELQLVVMVFLIVATFKTKMMSYAHCPSSFFMLQLWNHHDECDVHCHDFFSIA